MTAKTAKTSEKPKIIAIVGPTASGKSKFAIQTAAKINGEIISADSRLIYKGFDITAAKPTLDERQGIEHYLIDIAEPEVDYSVANFFDDAKAAIEKIRQKGKTPIVAGGTGLYFRILLEDFDLPRVKPNYELREKLEKLESEKLHEMLKKMDLKSAQKIHANNKVKIIRAIEVCKTLKIPHSEATGKKEPEFDVEWIGLNPPERADLYEKINKRVDEMIKKGLVEETKKLLEKHGRINNFVNTIGYQEMLEYLDGKFSFEEAVSNIKQNTRHYAKRQLTWFRRNKLITWI
jgi:tRNA dimethylallyltransferase